MSRPDNTITCQYIDLVARLVFVQGISSWFVNLRCRSTESLLSLASDPIRKFNYLTLDHHHGAKVNDHVNQYRQTKVGSRYGEFHTYVF